MNGLEQKYQFWLSIVTVCYNDEKNLTRTLDNLRRQPKDHVQIIVIDGGSEDNSKNIIQANQDLISDWVSEKDKGLYDAMNKGIQMCRGQYIVFLNAGDVFHDDHVLPYVFQNHQNADILYGDSIFVHQDGSYKSPRHKIIPKSLNWKSYKKGMVICHQALFVKSSIAVLYNTTYKVCADLDWAIRSTKKAASTCNLGITVCDFQDDGISSRKRIQALIERWRILSHHYGIWQTFWNHLSIPLAFIIWKSHRFRTLKWSSVRSFIHHFTVKL